MQDKTKQIINILRYWKIEEFLLPQSLDEKQIKEDRKQVLFGSLSELTDVINNLQQKSNDKNVWEFTLYGGIYPIDNIKKQLFNILNIPTKEYEFEGQRPSGKAASYTLSFDKDLLLKADEIQLSTAPWAIHKILEHQNLSGLNYSDFQNTEFDIREQVIGVFEKEKSLDENASPKVDQFCNLADSLICSTLGNELIEKNDYFQLIALKKKLKKQNTNQQCKPANNTNFLNSFYIEDLAKTISFVQEGETNALLFQYLDMEEQQGKVDIRQDTHYVDRTLYPENLPDGCWPTKGSWPLVYSQQFAINALQTRLLDDQGFYAINGPPGTGKTTLLRDLIAMVITERAKIIAKQNSPEDIFQRYNKKQIIEKSGGEKATYHALKEDFLGYDIVVASSNNGAVENVTKEIPAVDGIDKHWQEEIDFFADIGSVLIDEPAWSSMAAPLGNSHNKRNFVQNFFWGKKDNKNKGIVNPAISNYLLNVQKIPEAERLQQWQVAKDTFEQSLEKVKIYKSNKTKLVTEYQQYLQEIKDHEMQLEELSISLLALQDRHPSFWVKLLDTLFPFRKTHKQKILEKRDNYKLEIARTCNNMADTHKNNQSVCSNYLKAVGNHESDEAREKSCPWTNDKDFQKARTQVFIEALNLHKATIDVNAKKLRANLSIMMEVLNNNIGSSSSNEKGILHLWATLSLFVPVVSTTFASFSRLYPHLWNRKIGWLLIDEAGQANTKAAVGAIMRSKRIVVVGDPLQLEPITNLPVEVQNRLREEFKAHTDSLSMTSSVQKRADATEQHGTYLDGNNNEKIWVGSPLRVHRRCDSPMFDISNITTYKGLMVQGKKKEPCTFPKSKWIDVIANENHGHWIPKEGDQALKLAIKLLEQGLEKEEIYLVSPFRDVVSGLIKLFKVNKSTKKIKVGTIHTVQGKEARAVILVLGSSPNKEGARSWAAEKPNLLNVAVTRAKERLYIIGNKKLWQNKPYFSQAVIELEKKDSCKN